MITWNSVWYGFYGAFIKSTPQLCCLFIEDFNLISVRATLHLISQKSVPSAFSMKWFVYAIDLRQRIKVFTREGISPIIQFFFFGKHLVWSVPYDLPHEFNEFETRTCIYPLQYVFVPPFELLVQRD